MSAQDGIVRQGPASAHLGCIRLHGNISSGHWDALGYPGIAEVSGRMISGCE